MEKQTIVSPVKTIFRSFPDGYTVRSMLSSEAAGVQKWFGDLGLAISRPDLPILLDLCPAGSRVCYAGEFEGQTVASALQVPWGNNVRYVGLFYVEEKFRGRGFGSRLLNVVAREHAGSGILVLDAVEGWVGDVYKAWGYKEAFKIEHLRGVAKSSYCTDDFDGKILSCKEVDFEEILRYDNKCFLSRDCPIRRDFLRKLVDVPLVAMFVAVTGSGSVVGFGCRRPCIQEGHHVVGPLYAEDRSVAEAIMARLCSEVAGDYISIDICDRNEGAAALVKKFNFDHNSFLRRMHLNGDPQEFKVEVYGVTSIELCGF